MEATMVTTVKIQTRISEELENTAPEVPFFISVTVLSVNLGLG